MLKRIVLLIVAVVVVWIAASSELTTSLRPHIERGTELVWGWATDVKRRLEALRGKNEALAPVDSEKTASEEQIEVARDPFQSLVEQGVVNEEFREKGRTVREGRSLDRPAVEGETYEVRQRKKAQAETEVFADLYEQAKDSLFQAMKILEGRADEPQ